MPSVVSAKSFYTIQVGAFRLKENADNKVVRMRQLGFHANIVEIMDAQRKHWFTVRFGRYDRRDQARKGMAEYKQKENHAAVILHVDQ